MRSRRTTARILSVGSEILLGETVDTNAAHLGGALARLGVALDGVRALPDDRGVIAAAIAEARAAVDLVVVTGGLGPTHDDLTREGLAACLDEPLLEDPELAAHLRERWRGHGALPVSNLRQAMRIRSARILANPIGSAPGWWVDRDDSVVVLLPGVPSEMRRMWAEQVAPRLAGRFPLAPLLMRTVKCWGVGESRVADLLGALLATPGEGVEAGIYARDDGVHLRFSSSDPGRATALEGSVAGARAALGDDVWGEDNDDLATVALRTLASLGAATVASWEADTGGALLAVLSAVPEEAAGARYVGGTLERGDAVTTPLADAVIQLSLLPQGEHGRSRVRVSISGAVTMAPTALRIHGSGAQRQRRAAYAALDAVRRLRA